MPHIGRHCPRFILSYASVQVKNKRGKSELPKREKSELANSEG